MVKTRPQEEKFVENLIQTLQNPTRASVFFQLARKPESTATEISRRLGEDVDVVYYHLKLLKKAGLVSKPRVVVHKNYICKYYSLRPDFKEKFLESIKEYKRARTELAPNEYRQILIAFLTIIQSVVANSVRRLEQVDSDIIKKIMDKKNIKTEMISCSKERYDQLLGKLKEIAVSREYPTFDPIAKEYVIAIIAIPKLGENAD